MKEKEEILRKWRNDGFLKGFKEGSINEWRCAKSYNDLYEYIKLLDENDKLSCILKLGFPFIKRSLTTGKKRLYRFIKTNEIVTFFTETTMSDLSFYIASLLKEKKNNYKLQICMNICNVLMYHNMTIIDFFYYIAIMSEEYKHLRDILKPIIDVDADLLSIASDYFVEIKNLS